jgi:diguanylate cyclase (GGDEF)-like protein
MNQVDRNQTLLQLQVSLPKRVILTVLIMAMLIMFVFFFNIPNPNMILIAGLVICSALFGYGGGVVAGVIMFFYTLYFFSTGHSFTEFTPENLQKVGVSLVGIAVDMVFVCALKRAEMLAFAQVDNLTEELNRENERLKAISMTDALTDIRNRMALRNDFDSYRGHEATVMMLDLDNFKQINDTLGHAEGDRILKETGKLLADAFGAEHCYRYGGDEFLVIMPDTTEAEFEARLNPVLGKGSSIVIDGKQTKEEFSAGYVHGRLEEMSALREMIAAADERMYNAKHGKGLPDVRSNRS